MSEEPKRKKGRRPRKYPSDLKRPTMAFRCRSAMHEKLVASAKSAERSLSEEIEHRLNASFYAEALEVTLRRVVRQELGVPMPNEFETKMRRILHEEISIKNVMDRLPHLPIPHRSVKRVRPGKTEQADDGALKIEVLAS